MSEKYEFDARRYCQHNMERLGRMPNGQLVGLLMIREIDSRDVEIEDMKAEFAALKDRLDGAAKSLETISKQAGRDEYMETMSDVRAYAANRAMVASGEFARLCGEE